MSTEPQAQEEKIFFDPDPNPADSQYPIPVEDGYTPSPSLPRRPTPANDFTMGQPRALEVASASTIKSSDTQLPPYRPMRNMTDSLPMNDLPPSRNHTNSPFDPSRTLATTFSSPDLLTTPPPVPYHTVTPLRLLGDQTDTIDCPFCQKRSETKIKKHPSQQTHIVSTILFFATLFGVVAPYMCSCYYDTDHHCKACGRKVTHKPFNAQEPEVFGTPEHLREVSRYPPADAAASGV